MSERPVSLAPEGDLTALLLDHPAGQDQRVVHWIGGSLALGELRDAAHGLARLLARYGGSGAGAGRLRGE
jgi:hypothetical protein